MSEFNFNNKTFSLIENSANGQANSETLFKYKQKDNLITAEYAGGNVISGKIIGKLKNNSIEMLYQCLTTNQELKAGKAIANISLTKEKKIKLKLDWEWLDDANEQGTSEYIEH